MNHLIYIYRDDIKIFTKNDKDLEIFIQTERIYSQNIEIEFGIEKYVMIIMNKGGT